ncbi:MAG: bifunctional UDP-3-O-[3-hydroxymyristoyl] N-acetylglucosamine deacetylase/3-hydroxyacyl-ACP dehydratase [Saprospiraceae bacterium]
MMDTLVIQKKILTKPIKIKGVGLHTGNEVTLNILPAEPGFGIKFKRSDLKPEEWITADVQQVVTTNRGTTLQSSNASVATVEHLLSALHSLSIEDVIIDLDGAEVPILDGSALPFIEALESSGLESQASNKDVLVIEEAFNFFDDETGSEYVVVPSNELQLSCILEFDNPHVPSQFAELNNLNDFRDQIAPCRTFVFLSEIEKLFDQGLIKGGSIDNAIVIVDKEMSEEKKASLSVKIDKPNIRATKQGILNTVDLKFNNEPARHKILDMVGDFSLLGRPIQGKIIAKRPGHTSNVKFVKVLRSMYLEAKKNKGIPKYDPAIPSVMDVMKIQSLLPHRYPFLMVDKVIDLQKDSILAIKNITINEAFFQGHFPDNPVFPGVLQMEALAQAGGILALMIMDEGRGEKWDTYFLKMENVKFKAKVVPGDTLILKLELLEPIRRGIVHMKGSTFVGSKLVSEGELTAQIIKRS